VIPGNQTYQVDINAISSLDSYSKTVADTACGLDGSGSGCAIQNTAPVCGDINDGTLIPGAGSISAFSDILSVPPNANFPVDTTDCGMGLYAGCMTAPCTVTNNFDAAPPNGTGLQLAQCTCPTFTGTYQVPNFSEACTLNAGPNVVWSASNTQISKAPAPGFVGVPGTKNCNGVSVSALAHQFGGISNAAQAMGFGTVKNLQSAIKTFCGN
jgi:hypothetical protein